MTNREAEKTPRTAANKTTVEQPLNVGLTLVPPHDSEAEKAVLSCMLFDEEALSVCYDNLSAHDFYEPKNAEVFRAMRELHGGNTPVDVVTLSAELKKQPGILAAGGIEYISELLSLFYSPSSIKSYVKIVIDKSAARRLMKAGREIAYSAAAPEFDAYKTIDDAQKLIFDIGQNRAAEDLKHIKEPLFGSIEQIEQRYKNGERITGVPSGFRVIDDKAGGFQKSDLILVAARPSMGKTAFALNIVQNAAKIRNTTTAVFSLEMSAEQVANRFLCSEGLIDAARIRAGQLESEDWRRIAYASGKIAKQLIFIDDTPGITAARIRSSCRKLKAREDLGLIVVDYLQLMSGSGKRNDNRTNEISEISRSLKAIAREMSRAVESRSDHRPMLSDLRDSGAIEQDADVVLFLYRDEYYDASTDKRGVAEVLIAKQRNGPTGAAELAWVGQYAKFAEKEAAFSGGIKPEKTLCLERG
jgi:replicative DNA helicase